jgi:2-phosphosulfolactate phosphatase
LEQSLRIGDKNGIAVVIDVLRASSTIITAFINGIESIIPVKNLKEALDYKQKDYLLIGEKNGVKLENFHIGNSPIMLTNYLDRSNKKYNRGVILTTNATKILNSLNEAYIVSTLNLNAAKEIFKDKKLDIIMCGGNYGIKEDLIVGLALYGKIYGNISLNDKVIKKTILESKAKKHLEDIGYARDVGFIVNNINNYTIVPRLKNGIIKVN